MRLVKLQLKQFRQHRDTDVNFGAGLTGIIGNNGAGKSSLVEAAAFALYGTRATRGKVEDIKTRGAKKNSEAEVALTFEHAGQAFRVERNTSDAKLFLGGESEPFSHGTREVSDRVSHILGMNYEEFISTYFTEQKGLEFLSGKKGATERERFIVRMMGYDKLEKAQELLRIDRRDKRNEIQGWQAALGDRKELEARIEQEGALLSPLENKHSESKNVLQQAEKEVSAWKAVVAGFQDKREKFTEIKSRMSEKSVRLEEFAKRESSLLAEHTEIEKSLVNFGKVGVDYISQEKELRSKIEKAGDLVALDTTLLNELTVNWKEKLATLKAEIDINAKNLIEREKRQKEFSKLSNTARCPTCEQELGPTFSQVIEKQDEQLKELKSLVGELSQAAQALKDPPDEIRRLNGKILEAGNSLKGAQNALKELQSQRSVIERRDRIFVELAELRKQLGIVAQEISVEASLLEALSFSESEYTSSYNKLQSCERLLEVARLQRVKVEGELDKHIALLERSRAALRDHEERSALLDAGKKELLLLEESDRVLTDFRKALNASLRPRLADLAGEFLCDLTDGRYAAVDISPDFTPSVLEDGEVKPIISGGEEDLLNLCVRLALSQLLAERAGQSFSLLILDEVFGSLDESRRNNVLLLLEKLNSRFEQIILITHLDDIREGVHRLLSVQYDDSQGTATVYDEFSDSEVELAANV